MKYWFGWSSWLTFSAHVERCTTGLLNKRTRKKSHPLALTRHASKTLCLSRVFLEHCDVLTNLPVKRAQFA